MRGSRNVRRISVSFPVARRREIQNLAATLVDFFARDGGFGHGCAESCLGQGIHGEILLHPADKAKEG